MGWWHSLVCVAPRVRSNTFAEKPFLSASVAEDGINLHWRYIQWGYMPPDHLTTGLRGTYISLFRVKWKNCGIYYDVWPIKRRQASKRNKPNCQLWKKLTFDWLVDNPSQDLFGQKPQYRQGDKPLAKVVRCRESSSFLGLSTYPMRTQCRQH